MTTNGSRDRTDEVLGAPAVAEDVQRALDEYEAEREKTCACGHPRVACAPQRCSHSFARDAMWGDS